MPSPSNSRPESPSRSSSIQDKIALYNKMAKSPQTTPKKLAASKKINFFLMFNPNTANSKKVYRSAKPAGDSPGNNRTYGHIKDKFHKSCKTLKTLCEECLDLDHPIIKELSAKTLPPTVDLTSGFPNPFDQGRAASSASNAIIGLVVYELIKKGLADPSKCVDGGADMLSRLYLYWQERNMEGVCDSDCGSSLSDSLLALHTIGVCSELLWPHGDGVTFAQTPTAAMDADAKSRSSSLRQAVDVKNTTSVALDLTVMKHVLNANCPIVCGIEMYSGIESASASTTGVVEMPKPFEPSIGGHAVVLVGYDEHKVIGGHKGAFLVRNSWGSSWGTKAASGVRGYFWLPYVYLKKYGSDLWKIGAIASSGVAMSPEVTFQRVDRAFKHIKDKGRKSLKSLRSLGADHLHAGHPLIEALAASKPSLPSIDLTSGFPKPFDQLQLASSTANAIIGAMLFEQIREGKVDPSQCVSGGSDMLSRLYLYWQERSLEAVSGSDSGSSLSDGLSALLTIGVCSESLWPYGDGSTFSQAPTAAMDADAKKFQQVIDAKNVATVAVDVAVLKLIISSGCPIICGLEVYPGIESDKAATTGLVDMPKSSEASIGGHAVVLVGYDDNKTIGTNKGAFLIRNSWGISWGIAGTSGDRGYFWLPYTYVKKFGSDFWKIGVVTA